MIERITNLDQIDLEELKELAEEFYAESKEPGTLDFGHVCSNISMGLTAGYMSLWVLKDEHDVIRGAISGLIGPQMFTAKLIAIETFWFVSASYRRGLNGVKLLNKFIDWAVECKVGAIHLAFMEGIHPTHVADYYKSRGYTPLETIHCKRL